MRLAHFAAGCILGLALSSVRPLACSIPVFRYALDRWPADMYQLEVPPQGAQDSELAAILRNLGDDSAANLQAMPAAGDTARLLFPSSDQTVWTGPLAADRFQELTDSPARAELVKRLLAGESAVWVLIESGDTELDDQAAARLQRRLAFLEQVTALPSIDPTDPSNQLGPGPELRIQFSVLRLKSDDAAEEILRRMLLGPDATATPQSVGPVAAPVFGRGRVLGAWAMADLTDELVDEACLFLVGACSCQAKQLNPGWDLLLLVDWDSALRSAADGPETTKNEEAAEPETAVAEVVVADPREQPDQSENRSAGSSRILAWTGLAGAGLLLLFTALRGWGGRL